MGGGWTFAARLLHGLVGALLGVFLAVLGEWRLYVLDDDGLSLVLIGISAALCFILGFFGGPRLLNLLKNLWRWS